MASSASTAATAPTWSYESPVKKQKRSAAPPSTKVFDEKKAKKLLAVHVAELISRLEFVESESESEWDPVFDKFTPEQVSSLHTLWCSSCEKNHEIGGFRWRSGKDMSRVGDDVVGDADSVKMSKHATLVEPLRGTGKLYHTHTHPSKRDDKRYFPPSSEDIAHFLRSKYVEQVCDVQAASAQEDGKASQSAMKFTQRPDVFMVLAKEGFWRLIFRGEDLSKKTEYGSLESCSDGSDESPIDNIAEIYNTHLFSHVKDFHPDMFMSYFNTFFDTLCKLTLTPWPED